MDHLDLSQIMDVSPCFSLIAEILNSGYSEIERYQMASEVVPLLGNRLRQEDSVGPYNVPPAGVSPLLDFLSLCEKFYATGINAADSPHPGSIALRILSTAHEYVDCSPTILPVLSLTLLPTHPLQSRSLALKAFHRLMSGWFSTQLENLSYGDLDKLLQAVGDPFQLPQIPHLDEEGPGWRLDHEPMNSVVVLIEFASSDLWRNHLRRSNFTSCEETLSTEGGRITAIRRMLWTAIYIRRAFLHTPVKIVTAIRRLEELQCSNTAEVVIMWAWTVGVMDAMDHDGWKLVGDETLRFYQTHGIGRLAALKRHHIADTTDFEHLIFLVTKYEGSPCRMGSVKRSLFARPTWEKPSPTDEKDLRVSRVCQLRRLYHLFGCDPAT